MRPRRDGSSGLTIQLPDLLGTPVAALNLASGVVGEQLRTPYGQVRYSAAAVTAGGMHTTFGFTGQREDTQAPGSSGLDYFNARYYDPVVGRFTSADPTRPDLGSPWGTDAYGYVGGMVENATDPSGLELCGDAAIGCQGGGSMGAGFGGFKMDPVTSMKGVNATERGEATMGLAGVNPDALGSISDSVLGSGTDYISSTISFDRASETYTIKEPNGQTEYSSLGLDANEQVPATETPVQARESGDPTFLEQSKEQVQTELKAQEEQQQTQQQSGDTDNGGGQSGHDVTIYRAKQTGQTPGRPSSGDLGVHGRPNVNGTVDIKVKGGMVGPGYTGNQGLSTFNGINPAVRNVESWWQTSVSLLPDGLAAIPGTPRAYTHYSVAPAWDMTDAEYMGLLDLIPWSQVPVP